MTVEGSGIGSPSCEYSSLSREAAQLAVFLCALLEGFDPVPIVRQINATLS